MAEPHLYIKNQIGNFLKKNKNKIKLANRFHLPINSKPFIHKSLSSCKEK